MARRKSPGGKPRRRIPPGCEREAAWFRRFHGRGPAPGEVRRIRGECAAKLGRAPAILYEGPRPHRPAEGTRWKHAFAEHAKPDLFTTRAGRLTTDSKTFRTTATEGIKDMAKKRKKGHKNYFKNGSAGGGSVMPFVENIATTGAAGVGYAIASKVLLDKFWKAPNGATTEELSSLTRNKKIVRAVGGIALAYYIKRKMPRLAAGVGLGGAVVGFEALADEIGAEQSLRNMVEGTNTGSGVRQLSDGVRSADCNAPAANDRERVRRTG